MSDAKLGLFICDCGGAINGVLDTACLETCARELPGVALAQRLNYSCSPDGIETITAACAEQGLDRVVVAGCTPRLMSRHLQRTLPVAGDLIELADIREGCAWVHGSEPEQATAKALDAIAMAAARLDLRQARQPISGEVAPAALVIGGGVAGMTAALTLANAGQPVMLVEREAALGGTLTQAQRRNGLAGRIEQVTHHPNIELALNSQVSDVSGTVGRYTVSLGGGDRQFDVGAIIVATGAQMALQPGASVLAHLLGIRQDQQGYFPEVRYRLRPESYAERGIYVCGAAHHPADQRETEIQAISAAFKALRHLRAGQVSNGAPVARVDPALCTGCANCVAPCPFDAIAMHTRAEAVDLAEIAPLLCTGCGNCVVVCPVKAISQPIDSDAQVLAQIEAALRRADGGSADRRVTSADRRVTSANGAGGDRVRILVFGCEWSGHAAAELAGANRLGYPVETRLIRLRCSARFDPIHILWALFNGADGVFLGACAPGDCHYIDGNRYAQQRIATLGELLAANGFDPRRLRLEWIVPDDAYDFVTKISSFTELVAKL